MSARWLAGRRRDGARVRLFCFPHAGGGGGFFLPWCGALGAEIDVCPVVLPGREGRIREAPFHRLTGLLDELVPGLLPYVDREVAVFGHSMGAVVGYEFARLLEHRHGIQVRQLFVSGRRAPQLPARRGPLHALPADGFLAGLRTLNGTPPEVLADRNLLDLLIPTLRADFAVNETYRPSDGVGLSCPVGALTGNADPEVDLDEMAQWRAVTTGPFSLRVFEGDHFYLKQHPDALLAAVRGELLAAERKMLRTLN